ncbi:hypothetical protein GWI33_006749 [Rhynchophorus ferrugineus]|uniref:Uncharacterized protein n=1 Tax=Rhynchophorus ferrugineus TaxID=354439 RepID=A0A834IL94_RHYFE|nr:hypothetical protein GWI33_006749 [Rhynchophorus ferrugineus]
MAEKVIYVLGYDNYRENADYFFITEQLSDHKASNPSALVQSVRNPGPPLRSPFFSLSAHYIEKVLSAAAMFEPTNHRFPADTDDTTRFIRGAENAGRLTTDKMLDGLGGPDGEHDNKYTSIPREPIASPIPR